MAALALAAAAQTKKPPASSGPAMYRAYCASCHARDGKGIKPGTDLTTMLKRNDGIFPAVRLSRIVEGDAAIPAHGTRKMPAWGLVFRKMGGSDEATVKLRIRNLVRHIESLQAK
jgi:mono/diheme cytochrome c family protein